MMHDNDTVYKNQTGKGSGVSELNNSYFSFPYNICYNYHVEKLLAKQQPITHFVLFFDVLLK
jgi:hypothetical protein